MPGVGVEPGRSRGGGFTSLAPSLAPCAAPAVRPAGRLQAVHGGRFRPFCGPTPHNPCYATVFRAMAAGRFGLGPLLAEAPRSPRTRTRYWGNTKLHSLHISRMRFFPHIPTPLFFSPLCPLSPLLRWMGPLLGRGWVRRCVELEGVGGGVRKKYKKSAVFWWKVGVCGEGFRWNADSARQKASNFAPWLLGVWL